MPHHINLSFTISPHLDQKDEELLGLRLDKALFIKIAEHESGFSRSDIQNWIESGKVLLNQKTMQPKQSKIKLKSSSHYEVKIDIKIQDKIDDAPEPMVLDIVFEDSEILVINKPTGLVVHPGAGIDSGTLLNGILAHCPQNTALPRAGIVHRLDKETSGIMIIAKTLKAYQSLCTQFSEHSVDKNYQAIVRGQMIAGCTIDKPIARHPKHRTKMAIAPLDMGKDAVSHIRVLEKFKDFTYLSINIETGRTHQIRVHLSSIHHPIIGDNLYGGRLALPSGISEDLKQKIRALRGQILQAVSLSIDHPETGERMTFEAPLNHLFQELLEQLKLEKLN